ncbi:MAG: hypothetical protein JW810_05510 [Sedimentisphaerales bacterium]|nr:hypothetical protein [Sedimentisphaerales bacterium]
MNPAARGPAGALLASVLVWLFLLPAGGDTTLPAQTPVESIGPAAAPAVASPASPAAPPTTDQDANSPTTAPDTGRGPSLILPEGLLISGRRAKLIKKERDNRWFLVFEEEIESLPEVVAAREIPSSPTKPAVSPAVISSNAVPDKVSATGGQTDPIHYHHPMEVLPGKWLTAMLKVVANQVDMTVDFRVWGEVTTYQNLNYILPTFVATLSLFGKEAPTDAADAQRISPLEAALVRPGPQNNEQDNPADLPDDRQSELPEQLRIMLEKIPRTRPLELPEATTTSGSAAPQTPTDAMVAVKGAKTPPPARRDGQMVIDRVGRIHYDPEAGRWLFSFEADGASLAEPPMILHPCRLLEVMETAVQRANLSIRFRVSGQISIYQGRNYMLLRKVLMVYDLENFTK